MATLLKLITFVLYKPQSSYEAYALMMDIVMCWSATQDGILIGTHIYLTLTDA